MDDNTSKNIKKPSQLLKVHGGDTKYIPEEYSMFLKGKMKTVNKRRGKKKNITTQGVVIVEYIGDLYHGVKIRVCYTIGDDQTTDNCAGVICTVDVDIASRGTIF